MTLSAPEAPPAPKLDSPSAASSDVLTSRTAGRSPWAWLFAVVTLAALVGVAAGLHHRGGGSTTARRAPGTAASATTLRLLAKTVGHPVYWAGPKQGYTYELTHTTDGRIYVRYLPAGVAVGATAPDYLTVGTYPVKDALSTVRAIGSKGGGSLIKLTAGGLGAVDPDHPRSVYIAYPGLGYEVEVYDPSPDQTLQLVSSGGVVPVGTGVSASVAPVTPTAASIEDLRALAASSGHPIYWSGKHARNTYELSEASNGGIFVRYLPAGVSAGDERPFPTVATYPVRDAFAAVKKIALRTGTTTMKVANGGIAVIDPAHPNSVYLAYPHARVEVEVFDPSAAHALRLVRGGSVVPVP